LDGIESEYPTLSGGETFVWTSSVSVERPVVVTDAESNDLDMIEEARTKPPVNVFDATPTAEAEDDAPFTTSGDVDTAEPRDSGVIFSSPNADVSQAMRYSKCTFTSVTAVASLLVLVLL